MHRLPNDIIGEISQFLNLQDQDSLSGSCVKCHDYLAQRIDRKAGRLLLDNCGKLFKIHLKFRVKLFTVMDPIHILVTDYNDNQYFLVFDDYISYKTNYNLHSGMHFDYRPDPLKEIRHISHHGQAKHYYPDVIVKQGVKQHLTTSVELPQIEYVLTKNGNLFEYRMRLNKNRNLDEPMHLDTITRIHSDFIIQQIEHAHYSMNIPLCILLT